MANNLKSLLATAASMRAVGHSWEAIAEEVHKSVKTCQNWPNKHPKDWAEAYGAVEKHRFEQMSKEAQTHLHGLMRDKDKKIQLRAIDIYNRHAAKVYGPGGGMVFAYPAGPKPDEKPPSKTADLHAAGAAFMEAARERMDAERAKEGLPPLTEDEFLERHIREMDERLNHKPIPVYFDENGDSCAPPGEDDSRSREPSGTSVPADEGPARQAGPTRDLVWGVLFLAVLLTERAPLISATDRAPLRQASASRLTSIPFG